MGYLRRITGNSDNARWIGKRYLATTAAEIDLDTLISDRSMALIRNASLSDIGTAYVKQRASDFLHGDVLIIDNHMLARSEVHVCAILALS